MNFSPEPTGIGRYSGEMVQGLLARGHQVKVVCAPPYYPHWQRQPGHGAWSYSVEAPQPGLEVLRCPLWVPAQPRAARRLLHQASFALACLPVLLWLALSWRPAVVLAVAPATFCAPGAWLASRLAGAKAWLHVQDLELDAAFGLGFLRGRWLRKTALACERRLLRRFDHVSTISRRMLRQLGCKGVDLAQTSLLPNWVAPELLIAPEGAGATLRSELGIRADQKVLLFSGTMNRKQDLGSLVRAAALLQQRDDIVLVLCGAGEMKAPLQQQVQDLGLANVRLLALQPAHKLAALLAMADIHLLPQLRGAADLVLPSKLGGMLASGRPVIAAAEPGSEIAALMQHCGLPVAPEDPAAFAAAIQALCDDPVRCSELGSAAHYLARNTLGREPLLDSLANELGYLTAARQAPWWAGWLVRRLR